MFDFLIVGAGFAGCVVAERLAACCDAKVLIVDRRSHVGGNAYDCYNAEGVLVHKYGPHIFHTNSARVFAYLSQFTDWRPYEHRVVASVEGQLVPVPVNRDTLNQLYGLNLSCMEADAYLKSVAIPKDTLSTSEDVILSKVGRDLYEKVFRNYTKKQWGREAAELDGSVAARIPARTNRDSRYFTDRFQAMPQDGYSRLFDSMVSSKAIKILLNTSFDEIKGEIKYGGVVFTGSIDEFFDYRLGKLEYRSTRFEFKTFDCERFQCAAVVNYPNEHLYTRVTEFKYLTGQRHAKTTVAYEYPCDEGDPYYPIPRSATKDLYGQYVELARKLQNVYFAGRLGTYRYLNMDQVVGQALALAERIIGRSAFDNEDCLQSDGTRKVADGTTVQLAQQGS